LIDTLALMGVLLRFDTVNRGRWRGDVMFHAAKRSRIQILHVPPLSSIRQCWPNVSCDLS